MIEQAIYSNAGGGGYRFQARSPGFIEDWLPLAERLCTGFGDRPAGVACPASVFAHTFGSHHVAVVQVADQGQDDAGRPGALGFRLLVLPADLYVQLGGDPFHLAEQFPPSWEARDSLPTLSDVKAAPPRTVVDLKKILDVPKSATLLGGVQALLDGGRLVFERSEPDPTLLRGLWALLPTSSRAEMWPASFAFSNQHFFHVIVVPRAREGEYPDYLHEEQAGDYPEGRYELSLQTAVESHNQADLDGLLSCRSRSQMMRLAWFLLAAFILVPVISALIPLPRNPPAIVAETPNLPHEDECPPLGRDELTPLNERVNELARQVGSAPPKEADYRGLTDALEALDAKLGTPDPKRNPGRLQNLGALQRQTRALLWKHNVTDYDKKGLNTVELMDKLRDKLKADGKLN